MAKPILTAADLVQDDHNANLGSVRGSELIAQSLSEVGAGRGIAADVNGKVYAGNKTHEAWLAQGGKIVVVPTTGDTLVVTQRLDLDLDSPDPDTRARSRMAAYYDNVSAKISINLDPHVIAEDTSFAGLDLSKLFTAEELEAILEPLIEADDEAPDIDNAFGAFGHVASVDDTIVSFRFGDYAGQVAREVYDSFVEKYTELSADGLAPMMTDVLAQWLGLEDTQEHTQDAGQSYTDV